MLDLSVIMPFADASSASQPSFFLLIHLELRLKIYNLAFNGSTSLSELSADSVSDQAMAIEEAKQTYYPTHLPPELQRGAASDVVMYYVEGILRHSLTKFQIRWQSVVGLCRQT